MAMDEIGPGSEYVRLSSLRLGWLLVVDHPGARASMGQRLLLRRSRGTELEEIISPKSLIGKVRIQTAQQALEYVRVFSCPRRFQPSDREMGIEIRPIWEVNRGWLPNDVEIQNLKPGDYGVCTIAAFARLEFPVATVEKRERQFCHQPAFDGGGRQGRLEPIPLPRGRFPRRSICVAIPVFACKESRRHPLHHLATRSLVTRHSALRCPSGVTPNRRRKAREKALGFWYPQSSAISCTLFEVPFSSSAA
jgi:hypothetical protein